MGEEATLRFDAFGQRERTLTLRAAGLDEEPQEVSVFLNHGVEPIAEFELGSPDDVQEHSFELPEALVRDGSNELTFQFARTTLRSFIDSPFRMPWSATFVRLDFSDDAPQQSPRTPSPDEDDSSPQLVVEEVAGVSGIAPEQSIVFPQGGRVSFGIRIPRGVPRLETTLHVHPEDGGDGRSLPRHDAPSSRPIGSHDPLQGSA